MQPLACDVWLMERSAFHQMTGLINSPLRIDAERARSIAAAQPRRERKIGVIPVHGALEARPTFLGEMFGMSSYERIGQAFDALMADDAVTTIVLDVASPGGMVYGASELANKIHAARGVKPILAVANPLAASGAYWLAAAADRVIVTPSGDVGSVGVIAEHLSYTRSLDRTGIDATVIRSTDAPQKGETHPFEPLTDAAKEHMQARANVIHAVFVGDLARFRNRSVEHINEHFGKGRVVNAEAAIRAGMVDRIDTLEGTLQRIMAGRVRIGREAALDQWDAPTERDALRERAALISGVAEGIQQ